MFPADKRRIFPYHDGRADVFGDPLAIRRAMVRLAQPDDIEQVQKEAAQPLAFANPALDRLVAIVRGAFDLAPFDRATGGGLTEDEVLGVLKAFYDWEAALGEATGGTPSTSPPTDIPPASS